jgi:hypothetical protein
MYAFLVFQYVPHAHILHNLISRIICGDKYRSWSSLLCHLFHSLVPLRPKYSSQHPILKHPQPTLPPQCERPCFTPIQNHRQIYISLYLNFYIFGLQTGRQKSLHRMLLIIPVEIIYCNKNALKVSLINFKKSYNSQNVHKTTLAFHYSLLALSQLLPRSAIIGWFSDNPWN